MSQPEERVNGLALSRVCHGGVGKGDALLPLTTYGGRAGPPRSSEEEESGSCPSLAGALRRAGPPPHQGTTLELALLPPGGVSWPRGRESERAVSAPRWLGHCLSYLGQCWRARPGGVGVGELVI